MPEGIQKKKKTAAATDRRVSAITENGLKRAAKAINERKVSDAKASLT